MKLSGEDLRALRKDKGLRLIDLAQGNMSVQLLSKFERNECNISAEKMFKLLNRMNIVGYEIEQISLDEDVDDQVSFLNKFDNLILCSDIDGLSQLIVSEKKKLKLDGNFRHKFNINIVEQRINILLGLRLEKKKVKSVVNYLLKVNCWWSYEVSLFRIIIFCLDNEMAEFLYFRLIRQCKRRRYQDLVLGNVIYAVVEIVKATLDKNKFYTAQRYVNMSLGIFTDSRCYYEKNELFFGSGVCLFLNGNTSEGKKLYEDQ